MRIACAHTTWDYESEAQREPHVEMIKLLPRNCDVSVKVKSFISIRPLQGTLNVIYKENKLMDSSAH